jgi:hypothetical protein
MFLRADGACAGLWRRRGEVCDGRAPAAPVFRGQAGRGAALVFGLPGVPGVQDPLVAGDEHGRGEQREGCQSHEAAPAAADVVAGGVRGGGEAALGADGASMVSTGTPCSKT